MISYFPRKRKSHLSWRISMCHSPYGISSQWSVSGSSDHIYISSFLFSSFYLGTFLTPWFLSECYIFSFFLYIYMYIAKNHSLACIYDNLRCQLTMLALLAGKRRRYMSYKANTCFHVLPRQGNEKLRRNAFLWSKVKQHMKDSIAQRVKAVLHTNVTKYIKSVENTILYIFLGTKLTN